MYCVVIRWFGGYISLAVFLETWYIVDACLVEESRKYFLHKIDLVS